MIELYDGIVDSFFLKCSFIDGWMVSFDWLKFLLD